MLVPVKTGPGGAFRIEARSGASGALLWSLDSDYVLPPYNWVPSFSPTLTRSNVLFVPAAGGTVLRRRSPDLATGKVDRLAFYGAAAYEAQPATFDGTVQITTPITADARGNLFFGFRAAPGAPLGLQSGIARMTPSGKGTWTTAAAAGADPALRRVPYGAAPALSADGKVLYVALTRADANGFGAGVLAALDSRTLSPIAHVAVKDVLLPASDASLADDGTASPTVGPDGDVYFGVLEAVLGQHHARGWMLHFDAGLTQTKLPGAFGWDDTASIVPAAAVPGYAGPSSYLILTKYNDYVEGGGDGVNRMAILDPNASMTDPIGGATVMKEVLTIAGPTPDAEFVAAGHPLAVREWCVNTAVVDPATRSVLANNEDGVLYRWDLATNTLADRVVLTSGIGEAYTPTIVGPDGAVYAINNATLFAVDDATP
jgi:hypothetical protein